MGSMRQVLSRQSSGFWAIAALAGVCEALWLALVNVGFFMDSLSYLRYADVLIGRAMPFQTNAVIGHEMDLYAISRRTIGYPLMLLLGGVPFSGSLIGIVAIQAAMAVAMPLLFYKTLEPYSRRAALIGAIILIVTLEPFNYSKAILTEQSFKFLALLLIYLATLAYREPTRAKFAAIAAVCILFGLVRPQGSLVAVLVFGMLLLAHFKHWKSLAAHFFAVVLGLGISSFGSALYLVSQAPVEIPGNLQRPARTLPSRVKTLLLHHLYTVHDGGTSALDAKNGPERSKLRSVLQAYAEQFPMDWTPLAPKHYFGAHADNPTHWVDEIYRNPNPFYLNMIKVAVGAFTASNNEELSRAADGLILRVIWETYSREPRYILSFVTRYLLGSATSTGAQISWSQFYTSRRAPFGENNGPASKEILDLAKIYISDFPGYPPQQWRDYPGGPDKLVNDIFIQQANEGNFWFFWGVVDHLKGRTESGPIFYKSLWEFPDIYYLKSLLFIDKLTEFFFGMPTNHQSGNRIYDDGSIFLFSFTPEYDVPARMREEIESGLQPSAFHRLILGSPHYGSYVRWYTLLWLVARNVIHLSILATLLFCFRVGAGWPAALIGLVILCQASVIALATDTAIRYVDQILPLSILLAVLSVSSLLRVGGMYKFPLRGAAGD
jgi:hypothetical protein